MNNSEEVVSEIISTTHSNSLSIFSLIYGADSISQCVMLLLFILSVISWAIIIEKLYKYNLIKKNMKFFEEVFWSGSSFDHLYERFKNKIDNPLAAIFISSMNEFRQGISHKIKTDNILKIGQKDRINRTIELVKDKETEALESNLSFLASIGAYAPFIGVFGTVCGIMHSFQSIAVSKNTSLAAVAPGIAEALLATAIALIAAIVASFFYSYLATILGYITNRMDDYSAELYNILSRSIDSDGV
ncbi:MAG: MotA/TolQ/ExbB proton channel family protein [Rickettsiaceae bacterium]|nr:MotA/TolQ/ExbB proton channel family protein [Rickettsiaceae bacterium]